MLCPDNQKYARSRNGQNILSEKYRNAKTMAAVLLRSQSRGRSYAVPCALTLQFHVPDNRQRDCGNHLKLLSDALEQSGVVANDTLFHDIRILRSGLSRETPGVLVEVTPL